MYQSVGLSVSFLKFYYSWPSLQLIDIYQEIFTSNREKVHWDFFKYSWGQFFCYHWFSTLRWSIFLTLAACGISVHFQPFYQKLLAALQVHGTKRQVYGVSFPWPMLLWRNKGTDSPLIFVILDFLSGPKSFCLEWIPSVYDQQEVQNDLYLASTVYISWQPRRQLAVIIQRRRSVLIEHGAVDRIMDTVSV